MKSLIARFKRFANDEDGMEFIQVAVIVVAVIALAAVVILLYGRISDAINGVQVELPDAPGLSLDSIHGN